MIKYNEKCTENGHKFFLIINETTGKFYPVTDTLFNIILNTMNNGMQPEYANISKFYWAARLCCCLQKFISYAIAASKIQYCLVMEKQFEDFSSVILIQPTL